MFTPFSEIDDIQVGTVVYVPIEKGFPNSLEGKTTTWKPYTVDRYYKRGYEDRVTAVSESGGEIRLRYHAIDGLWKLDNMSDRVSATPIADSWYSNHSTGWV